MLFSICIEFDYNIYIIHVSITVGESFTSDIFCARTIIFLWRLLLFVIKKCWKNLTELSGRLILNDGHYSDSYKIKYLVIKLLEKNFRVILKKKKYYIYLLFFSQKSTVCKWSFGNNLRNPNLFFVLLKFVNTLTTYG